MSNVKTLLAIIKKAGPDNFNCPKEWSRLEQGFAIDVNGLQEDNYRKWIFSHDFAKAFWGEEKPKVPITLWQHHLQQMVLEEDPIKYLETFLKD